MIITGQITIADEAQRICAHDEPGGAGRTVTVTNRDEKNSVWIGGPDVTVETGYELPAGKTVT